MSQNLTTSNNYNELKNENNALNLQIIQLKQLIERTGVNQNNVQNTGSGSAYAHLAANGFVNIFDDNSENKENN
jgi:hypothetical protein